MRKQSNHLLFITIVIKITIYSYKSILMKCSVTTFYVCTVVLVHSIFTKIFFVLQCFVCFPWKQFRDG